MLSRSPFSNIIQNEYDQLQKLITEVRAAYRNLFTIQVPLSREEYNSKYYSLFKAFSNRVSSYLSITLSDKNTSDCEGAFEFYRRRFSFYDYTHPQSKQLVELIELEEAFDGLVSQVGKATAINQTEHDNQYNIGMRDALSKIESRLANIEKQLARAPKPFLPDNVAAKESGLTP